MYQTLNNKVNLCCLAIIVGLSSYSCVETFDFESEIEDFENALVVEATITNELKQQRILLSRSSTLKNVNGAIPESEAVVVVNNNTTSFTFIECNPGEYMSKAPFAAHENSEYYIEITTHDGRKYSSLKKQLTPAISIEALYVERGIDENEEEGVFVFIDNINASEKTKYYRYDYEETYKIIAPNYSPQELIPRDIEFPIALTDIPGDNYDDMIDFFVELRLREEQEQICYNTNTLNTIILASSNEFVNNELGQVKIRFINRNDYRISHRYSILVKQYVISKEAHVFYKTLKNFSEVNYVFSEQQTGFVQGNIFSIKNPKEKVIGFFDVASVNEKRVFFNYSDLFPDEILPPYYVNCDDYFAPPLIKTDSENNVFGSPLFEALNVGMQFLEVNDATNPNILLTGPFRLVIQPCGDCTVLGSNSVPAFWSE